MTMLDSIVRREESLQGRCLLGISISVTDQQGHLTVQHARRSQ